VCVTTQPMRGDVRCGRGWLIVRAYAATQTT